MTSREEVFECNGDEEDDELTLSLQRETFKEAARARFDEDGALVDSNVSPSDAFAVFQGHIFTKTSEYTFPDHVEQRVETPMARFTRLKMELSELQADLDDLVKEDKPEGSTIWAALQAEARKLADNAKSLGGHNGFQVFDRKAAGIAGRLDNVINGNDKKKSDSTASSSSSGSANHAMSPSLMADESQIANLERRVYHMESVLGSASNVLDCESTHAGSLSISGQSGSAVSGGGTTLPLINAIAKLEKRIALLDGPTLDALKAKATVLKSELEAAANAKTSRSTTASEIKVIEAVRKVDDLYEKINRVQAVATDLPALVLRLKTLETVHQTSANFTQRLAELESIARGAAEDIKNNSEVLGNLKQGLVENVSAVKDKIYQMEKHIGETK